MQLTKKQLKIQERADKTLSYNCLIGNVFVEGKMLRTCELAWLVSIYPNASSGSARFNKDFEVIYPQIGTSDMLRGELRFVPYGENNTYRIDNLSVDNFNERCKTISNFGHPMNRGRLCYLARNNHLCCTDTLSAWGDICILFDECPELYNQTIIEWEEIAIDKVIDFLETLPKDD